jgi:hypothetical protein
METNFVGNILLFFTVVDVNVFSAVQQHQSCVWLRLRQ